ncbi:hypothetical protein L7F22_036232 [Adiantum nelumboides]|nr:hypothetical protein [Adiantum nelumboides]
MGNSSEDTSEIKSCLYEDFEEARKAWNGQVPILEVRIPVQDLMDAVAQYAMNAVILFFPGKMPTAQDVGQWVDFLLKRQVVRGVYFGARGFYEVLLADTEARNLLLEMSPLFFNTQMTRVLPWALTKDYQSLIRHKCPVWVEIVDFPRTWRVGCAARESDMPPKLNANTNRFCILWDTDKPTPEGIMVDSGPPKMDKVEIEGRGYHTNLYAVRGIYSGGKEGKSMIQWFRAVSGRPDLIPIIGEIGRMYEANVDDIGCRLVAVYTPVREDGVGGVPVSASTELITVEPEVAREVKQKLELGAVKFEALRDRELPTMKGLGSLERRILDVNKKRFKVVKPGSKTSFPNTEIRGTYSPPFHVDIIQNDQHRLKVVVDGENEVDLMVQTRHIRDVIVLVLRGFAQRFNAVAVPTLLKP